VAESEEEDCVYYFDQRMSRDWANMLQGSQQETHYRAEGRRFERVPYGRETFRNPGEAKREPCRHCCTIGGRLHEPGCDYEECPKCTRQLMSCDCEFLGHEWK